VHLSPDVATALVVGRRRAADVVVLAVEAGAMAAAGHVFHRSQNGVWLTAAIPAGRLREHSE
jgi:putative RNA 2'-phosphotransferase